MSWFVALTLKSGETIHVRPDMVKAVYQKAGGEVNIVVDGHDFDIIGTVPDILRAVEYSVQPEQY